MREAATFTLGRSGDKRAVPPLIKALDDRRETRAGARVPRPRADRRPARRPRADRRAQRCEQAVDAVRAACAYAIGARKLAAGVPALLAALDDNRGETQRLAAWALGQLGEPKALGPLIRAYFARAGQAADELVWAIGRVSGAGLAPCAARRASSDYPMRAGKLQPHRSAARPARVAAAAGARREARRRSRERHRDRASRRRSASIATSSSRCSPISTAHPIASRSARSRRRRNDAEVDGRARDDRAGDRAAGHRAARRARIPKVRALAVSVLAKLDGGKINKADAAITQGARPIPPTRSARRPCSRSRSSPSAGAARPPELVARPDQDARTGVVGRPPGRRARRSASSARRRTPRALIKAAKDPSSFVREAVAVALGQIGGAQVPRRPRRCSPKTRSRRSARRPPHARSASSNARLLQPIRQRPVL